MCNYNKTQISPYDPTKLAIHIVLRPEDDFISKRGQNFKKTFPFDDILHFFDEQNIVACVVFACGITFYPETPTKVKQIKRERNCISRTCEKSRCNQHNCSITEQHSSNNFLNPLKLWEMFPAAPMSFSHPHKTYSMSNQYPQPTSHQPRADSYPAFSSLRTMDSKRKGLRVSFAFFQKNYLLDGRLNETVATVAELSDLCKPGAMDGIPPSVMNFKCF